jgi:branched-chain amino acid transport system permease protein
MMQFIANGLCRGSAYALVAMGFALIYTTSGVFHIAHGAIYTAAAYAIYCFFILLELPFALAVVLALLSTALLGALVELMVYRPLDKRKASSAVLMISSLGVYIVMINLLALCFGNETKILRSGVETTVSFGDVILTRVQIAQMVVALSVVALYWLFLRRTSLGRICRSVADDSVLASVLGVKVESTRLVVFAVGSILAAIGAGLVALDVGIDPYIGFPAVLAAAVACIVGGLHRFIAPALGGVLLGVIQSLVVWQTSTKWESAVTFALLLAFLLFRPQGLLGIRKRLEER